MNRATHGRPDDDEDPIGRWISEAGDPHVEPRAGHVADLRSLVLGRLAPSRPARRWKARLLVGSGLAALTAVAVVALLTIGRPVVAWSQVAEALQGRSWVHGKLVGPDEKVMFEEWLSPKRDLAGLKAGPVVAFHDRKRQVFTKYLPAEGVVYRLPEPPPGTATEGDFLRQVLDLLLDPKGPAKFPFSGMELIGQTSREVEEDGQKCLEIELSFRVAGGSRGAPLPMRIRVDASTKLPRSLVMQGEDGTSYRASIDYPDRGPADIFDLGVPRTAKVVDRAPGEDVDRVLARLKAGRDQFDDYRAFVVEERLKTLPGHLMPRFEVHRAWRKGKKWRIDRLRPEAEGWAPPVDAGPAWWREHQGEFVLVPRIVCDGQQYWDYYLEDTWKPGMPLPAPGLGVVAGLGQVIGPNPLSGPADDPVIPWWCQDIRPEQAGHPSAGIYRPDHDREFLVEARPEVGPPGTILLRGRDPNILLKPSPDHFRLWIDPGANSLAMRTELRVNQANDPTKVAFIDTHVLELVAKSPKGFAYPSRSRHITQNDQSEVLTTFIVDFEAQIPDELFLPPK